MSTSSKADKTPQVLDEARVQPADTRDPRYSADQWPCFGNHKPGKGANRWGVWRECMVCAFRVSYTPFVGAPGHETMATNPTDVKEALNRLQTQGMTSDRLVKLTLKEIQQEHRELAKELKQTQAATKAASKPKSKAAPKSRSTASSSATPPEQQEQEIPPEVPVSNFDELDVEALLAAKLASRNWSRLVRALVEQARTWDWQMARTEYEQLEDL